MERPRFQFTIRRLVQLVALAAFDCYLFHLGFRLVAAAWTLALPGFFLDRARGGSGIFGSMMAGLLGFVTIAVACNLYAHLAWGGTAFDMTPGTLVTTSGMIGLLGGTTFGVCAWTLLSLGGLIGRLRARWRPGPKPDRGDSQDPTVRVGVVLPEGRNE